MTIIDIFAGQNRFLSNFYEFDDRRPMITDLGIEYTCVETFYQASKTMDLDIRRHVATLTPGQAKRFGRGIDLDRNWDYMKLDVMVFAVQQKFSHPELARLLLATGDAILIEGNTWGDTFWGRCNGQGENHLGNILMQVRSALRGEQMHHIMVTGHRSVNEQVVHDALIMLYTRAVNKFGKDEVTLIAGGARGADTIQARVAMEMGLKLHLEIPHPGYYDNYHPIPQSDWDEFMAYATSMNYTVDNAARFDWRYNFRRNEAMIRMAQSHVCVSNDDPRFLADHYGQVVNGRKISGGTAGCAQSMKRMGVRGCFWVNAQTGETTWVVF